MNRQRIILITFFILFFQFLKASNPDTLKLYQNKCGMQYKKYIWQLYWFPPKSPRDRFSCSPWTKQDRYFDDQIDTATYIIFYNHFNNIKWEGPIQNGSIQGTVIYYYNNGKVKRTEQFGYEKSGYWESDYNWSDAPYEKGNWKYYKRSGRLFKERQYLTLKSLDDQNYYRLCNISYFDKKKTINKTKAVLLDPDNAVSKLS